MPKARPLLEPTRLQPIPSIMITTTGRKHALIYRKEEEAVPTLRAMHLHQGQTMGLGTEARATLQELQGTIA